MASVRAAGVRALLLPSRNLTDRVFYYYVISRSRAGDGTVLARPGDGFGRKFAAGDSCARFRHAGDGVGKLKFGTARRGRRIGSNAPGTVQLKRKIWPEHDTSVSRSRVVYPESPLKHEE
jgi:hypothetical protein